MSIDLFDPTASPEKTPPERTPIDYVSRPESIEGLKVGLVDNAKFNSKTLLLKIADRLSSKYNVEMTHVVTKSSPAHPVSDSAIEAFRGNADFVLAGIGD